MMNITAYGIFGLAMLNAPIESDIISNPYLQGAGVAVLFIGCTYMREWIAKWRNPYEIVYRHSDDAVMRCGKYMLVGPRYYEIDVVRHGKRLTPKEVGAIRWDTGYGWWTIDRFLDNMRPRNDITPRYGCQRDGKPVWSVFQRNILHEMVKQQLPSGH